MLIVGEDAAAVERLEARVGDGVHPVQRGEALFEAAAFGSGQDSQCEGVGGLLAVGGEEPVAELVGEVEPLGELVRHREGEAVDKEQGVAVAVDLDGCGAEPHETGAYALYEWPLHGFLFFAQHEDERDDDGDAAEDDDGECGAVAEGEGTVGFVDGAVGGVGCAGVAVGVAHNAADAAEDVAEVADEVVPAEAAAGLGLLVEVAHIVWHLRSYHVRVVPLGHAVAEGIGGGYDLFFHGCNLLRKPDPAVRFRLSVVSEGVLVSLREDRSRW